jgi:hypothetical protein
MAGYGGGEIESRNSLIGWRRASGQQQPAQPCGFFGIPKPAADCSLGTCTGTGTGLLTYGVISEQTVQTVSSLGYIIG